MKRLLVLFVLLTSCSRAPIKSSSEALRPTTAVKGSADLKDDLELNGLAQALDITILALKKNPNKSMNFGSRQILQGDYATLLFLLSQKIDKPDNGQSFFTALEQYFEVHEVFGTDDGWSKVFVTSYFSPIVKGSLKPKAPYTSPVLRRPKDLVKIRIDEFQKALPSLQSSALGDAVRDGVLRGRSVQAGDSIEIRPYLTREEIRQQSDKIRKEHVICYLDPVDHFFLQIQGSGIVELENGRHISLVYAEQNGHSYFPIGRALKDIIPKDQMSLQAIRDHLRSLSAAEQAGLMDQNPSFVFFDSAKTEAVTSMGVEAQAGRTIATDSRYFPKGSLAFLFHPAADKDVPEGGRFVMDHDTGGAIRGPGRVDLYWGKGAWAEEVSGRMKGDGRLYYFVPRPDALGRLNQELSK